MGSAVLVGACALALDSTDAPTTKCQFKGDDNACGACIHANCEMPLNTCCGDSTCQATMIAIDQCASQSDLAACERVDADNTIGSCFLRWCSSLCKSQGPCTMLGEECRCANSAPTSAEQTVCESGSVYGGVCCADHGWPANGLTCDCTGNHCSGGYDNCSCSITDAGDSGLCDGTHCCLDATSCHCSTTDCSPGEQAVTECDSQAVPCVGRVSVSTCASAAN
jgi:hypothetical protein